MNVISSLVRRVVKVAGVALGIGAGVNQINSAGDASGPISNVLDKVGFAAIGTLVAMWASKDFFNLVGWVVHGAQKSAVGGHAKQSLGDGIVFS